MRTLDRAFPPPHIVSTPSQQDSHDGLELIVKY